MTKVRGGKGRKARVVSIRKIRQKAVSKIQLFRGNQEMFNEQSEQLLVLQRKQVTHLKDQKDFS